MRSAGQKTLVTGAAGGIGRAIVSGLLYEGAEVVMSDRESPRVAGATAIDGDLRDAGFRDALPWRAAETLGGLKILCNNPGVIARGR